MPPDAFLHHLEGSNLEIVIGERVIEAALKQMASWQAAGRHLVVRLDAGQGPPKRA